MRHAVYTRTQAVSLVCAIAPCVLVGLGVAIGLEGGADVPQRLAFVAGTCVLVLLMVGRFTVSVGEGHLAWRFGELGWPRWKVALDTITSVEVTTSTAWEGWGIRRTRSGWLYNASGRQALRVNLRGGRTLRLGSDEPERLASFIRTRLSQPAARP
jgi:hypothetical protein